MTRSRARPRLTSRPPIGTLVYARGFGFKCNIYQVIGHSDDGIRFEVKNNDPTYDFSLGYFRWKHSMWSLASPHDIILNARLPCPTS